MFCCHAGSPPAALNPNPITTPTPTPGTPIATPTPSPAPTTTTSQSSSKSNTPAIVGGVVGGVCGLIALTLVVWHLRKKNKRRSEANRTSSVQPLVSAAICVAYSLTHAVWHAPSLPGQTLALCVFTRCHVVCMCAMCTSWPCGVCAQGSKREDQSDTLPMGEDLHIPPPPPPGRQLPGSAGDAHVAVVIAKNDKRGPKSGENTPQQQTTVALTSASDKSASGPGPSNAPPQKSVSGLAPGSESNTGLLGAGGVVVTPSQTGGPQSSTNAGGAGASVFQSPAATGPVMYALGSPPNSGMGRALGSAVGSVSGSSLSQRPTMSSLQGAMPSGPGSMSVLSAEEEMAYQVRRPHVSLLHRHTVRLS